MKGNVLQIVFFCVCFIIVLLFHLSSADLFPISSFFSHCYFSAYGKLATQKSVFLDVSQTYANAQESNFFFLVSLMKLTLVLYIPF